MEVFQPRVDVPLAIVSGLSVQLPLWPRVDRTSGSPAHALVAFGVISSGSL